jgi:hypothetical protein
MFLTDTASIFADYSRSAQLGVRMRLAFGA